MEKLFFTKATPKAVRGIRRVFESSGYEVHAIRSPDGTSIVVAMRESRPC